MTHSQCVRPVLGFLASAIALGSIGCAASPSGPTPAAASSPAAPGIVATNTAGSPATLASCLGGSGAPSCFSTPRVQAQSGRSATVIAPPVLNNNQPVQISDSTVTLTWTASAGAISYLIEVASTPGGPANLAAYNTGNPSTTIVVPGVPDGTYYVRVRAADATGALSAASNEVQVIVGASSAPRALHVMSLIGGNLTLGWQPPAAGPPLSYVIQFSSAPGAANLASVVANRSATTAPIPALAAGTYYVRLYGTTSCPAPPCLSPPSNEIVVTVEPDGRRPYRLTLHVPYTYYCQPTTTEGFDFLYDGNLDVQGNTLTFTMPENLLVYWTFLTLRLTVAADRASGTIVSDGAIARAIAWVVGGHGYPARTLIGAERSSTYPQTSMSPAATAGTVGGDGRIAGAFDGYLFSDDINPIRVCTGHFLWSLAPIEFVSVAADVAPVGPHILSRFIHSSTPLFN